MTEIRHRHAAYGKNLIPATRYAITYKDVFSLKYLYTLLHEWLVEEGYAPRADEEFPEAFYLQSEKPVTGNEYWIRWRLSKQPYPTKLWRFLLDIDMHVLTLKKVEFVLAGKKYEADKGEIEITVDANLIVDPEKMFDKPLIRSFKWLVLKRLLKSRLDRIKKELYDDAYRLEDAIRTYLKLETYLPEKELAEFWARRPEV